MERIFRASLNTWNGIMAAARSEAAFRQELAALLLGIPLAFVIAAEPWKRLALIGVLIFVLVVELINTAIEKLADRVTLSIDPRIGTVKDMGSAAVAASICIAGLTWLVAFAEWVMG
jgi:diacylglycerol kinase (ATP)